MGWSQSLLLGSQERVGRADCWEGLRCVPGVGVTDQGLPPALAFPSRCLCVQEESWWGCQGSGEEGQLPLHTGLKVGPTVGGQAWAAVNPQAGCPPGQTRFSGGRCATGGSKSCTQPLPKAHLYLNGAVDPPYQSSAQFRRAPAASLRVIPLYFSFCSLSPVCVCLSVS